MPIEDRNLQAGIVLVGRHKGTEHRCEVVETPEGVRYQVASETFKSPSSAAKHVTGGAVNGWVFWSVEGTEPKRAREPKVDEAAKAKKEPAAKKKAAKKSSKKAKSARTASSASYGCGVCPETFPTMKAATQHALTHTA